MLIWLLIVFILTATGYWLSIVYSYFTEPVPARGGKYIEGIVGQPSLINPLFSSVSEVDSDLTELIYDGILRYDPDGKLENNMAEEWSVNEDGTYTIHLKQDMHWHDDEEVLSDDVVFTYQLIQDGQYKSPLRYRWIDAEISQVDEYTLEISLPEPRTSFAENLTVGILPRHIWETVSPERVQLSPFNLEPIGSGPFYYKGAQKDADGNVLVYDMGAFQDYHNGAPYLGEFSFHFFASKQDLIDAYKNREVMGLNNVDFKQLGEFRGYGDLVIHNALIPHFYGVFFNQTKSVPLAYDEVREALALSVNRSEIIDNGLGGNGEAIQSLFLPGAVGYRSNLVDRGVDVDAANTLLEESGWVLESDGVRKKDDVRLEFTLMVPDWPGEAAETAPFLASQWAQVGVKVNVNVVTVYDLIQNFIKPREYDALLFANVTDLTPDPLVFWHSDQKKDPGSNYALFGNEDADDILKKARKTIDPNKRQELFFEWQDIIEKENPAIYLFSPRYLYPVIDQVAGIEMGRIANPSDRFSHIESWFMKTERVRRKE